MNRSLRNYLLPNRLMICVICILVGLQGKSQVANYIANGSFEDHYTCAPFYPARLAKYWMSIDSLEYAGSYCSKCDMSVPLNGNGYQYPKTGEAYVISTMYCLIQGCARGHLKNRLRKKLQAGKTYCVKFHVNITNASPRGMDGFGIYFGDSTLDTITKFNAPLSYIVPQVKNPVGYVISDSMNWVPITGTFVANGSEKYAVIGNFLADNAVSTSPIYTPYYPQFWTDVNFDDVSCIEIDLPAYAGPDKSCALGDSAFIGRSPDFAIDPGCVWYKLPDTNPAIDTVSGLWVKPVVTTTYVVRQLLECSALKWDTVVIYANPVGLHERSFANENLKVFPVPAQDEITLQFTIPQIEEQFKIISIYNNLGQLLREEEISFKNKAVTIMTGDLENGVYYLRLKSVSLQTVSKRFVIAR